MTKKLLQFSVVYQQNPDGGYIATVPALPGCHTQGKTIEQVEDRIKEAVEVYLESAQANKERIPSQKRKLFLGSIAV